MNSSGDALGITCKIDTWDLNKMRSAWLVGGMQNIRELFIRHKVPGCE
jgi:hypothetical protein